jgi:HK97 family phage major capsid protein
MTNGSAAWEGETAEADDANITFGNIKLQPHRLSTTIEVSKQFIMQDSCGAENAIREEIVNAIAQKLEATIFGNANTAGQPKGIFYGMTDTVANFADICEMESDLEEAKVYGPYKYVMSPSAKAALRGMIKGTNATGMVYENGEVDGTPAISTGLVTGKKVAVGDWGHTVLGQWGAIDLVVDPFTKAKNASIVLTVNAWFDFKVLRDGAIKTYSIVDGDQPAS